MAKSKKTRFIKWGIILVLLGATGAAATWYLKHRADTALQYQTTTVIRGDVTQYVTATGQLNPVTNVTVGSQISGTIQKLYADYNTHVTNGQMVAQIEPFIYQATVQQVSADLASSRASLELAQVNARRAKELFESKLIPQSDYDVAVASLHQSEAAVQNKQASLNRAQVDLDHCAIYAPVDGLVISRNVDVGQTVAASLSAPTLFVIANDLTKMQIDSNVAEADIGGIAVDQNVDFTVDAFPNRTFHGRVRQVRNAPITVQNVVTYDTVIDVSNPDLKLKPGMTANVSIIIALHKEVLKVPNAALRFRPPEPATNAAPVAVSTGARPGGGAGARARGERRSSRTVYVLKESKPEPIQIKTGISDGVDTEVTEGLSESNRVVTAVLSKQAAAQTTNPFSGGMRFR